LSEDLNRREHLGDSGRDGGIILKRMLRKYCVRVWTRFNRLRTRSISVEKMAMKLLEQLSDSQLLKKVSGPWSCSM
jgi:hypothetical protein